MAWNWTPPAADPNNPLNKFMAPVPRFARYASVSCAVLMTVISWLTYVGVYRWVAEAQLALMNQFELHITFILTILVYMAFFGLAARLMVSLKILPRATPEEAAKVLEANARMSMHRLSPTMLIWMILPWAIVGLICGIYSKHAASIKAPTVVTMAEIDGGKVPRGTWLEVTGGIYPDSYIQYGDQYKPDYYTPLITPSWDPTKPLVVMIESKEQLKPGQVTLKGMRWPLGVPGPVRAIFERNGVNADDAILLEVPDTPRDWDLPGNFFTIGGGLGLAGCGAAFFFGRRDKRAQAPPGLLPTPLVTKVQPQDIHSD
jgi:hypothetical protein